MSPCECDSIIFNQCKNSMKGDTSLPWSKFGDNSCLSCELCGRISWWIGVKIACKDKFQSESNTCFQRGLHLDALSIDSVFDGSNRCWVLVQVLPHRVWCYKVFLPCFGFKLTTCPTCHVIQNFCKPSHFLASVRVRGIWLRFIKWNINLCATMTLGAILIELDVFLM